jgi:dienelactone hydrolase
MSIKLAAMIGTTAVERHQGQRTYAPRQQAGHMTGSCHADVPVAFRIVPGANHGFMGAGSPPPQVVDTLAFIGAWFAAVR